MSTHSSLAKWLARSFRSRTKKVSAAETVKENHLPSALAKTSSASLDWVEMVENRDWKNRAIARTEIFHMIPTPMRSGRG